jgi:glycosyltransferase involved in cell wall biosynthesis
MEQHSTTTGPALRAPAKAPSLSILICTINRPQELHRCLTSITAGKELPEEILVSDDSPAGRETAAVCAAFPAVRYFEGPRRGLCANRNAVIRHARTEFVSLLDDDAVVSEDFVSLSLPILAELPAKTLVTGTTIEADRPVVPGNPSFLGFFGQPPKGRFKNINLNTNLLPRAAFAEANFDETISYGYEDMDLCARLLSKGYAIRHEPSLVNTHLPPPRTAALERERSALAARARFYTSVKRLLLYEHNLPKLLAYTVIAPTHRALYAVRTGEWLDVPNAVTDMGFALRAGFREQARERKANRAQRG